MSAKTQHYADLADRTVAEITSDAAHWAAFLCTAARNHKYSFEDQVMIHAQRPRATACAAYDFWKKRMRRYVRARSVGIALLRQQNGKASLAYVFDISDTGTTSDSVPVRQWKYSDQHREAVAERLSEVFAAPPCAGLAEQLIRISVQLADTGITPGSGVGNARAALDQRSLGVPVIAVGVPTVVDGATLAADLLAEAGQGDLASQTLQGAGEGVLVTPRDIDAKVTDLAKVVGFGINLALQEGLTVEDVELYLS